MKGRSQDQGLILIAGDQEQLTGYIRRNEFWASAQKYWPGAVTCVVEAAVGLPELDQRGARRLCGCARQRL